MPRPALGRSGFTLMEILISLLIFSVVGTAMITVLTLATNVYRGGEFQRAATDIATSAISALDEDLSLRTSLADQGFLRVAVADPTAGPGADPSGNVILAFSARTRTSDLLQAADANATTTMQLDATTRVGSTRQIAIWWVRRDPNPPQRYTLRRLAIDDSQNFTTTLSNLFQVEVVSWSNASVGVTLMSNIQQAHNSLAGDWIARHIAAMWEADFQSVTLTADVSLRNGSTTTLTTTLVGEEITAGCLQFGAAVSTTQTPRLRDLAASPEWWMAGEQNALLPAAYDGILLPDVGQQLLLGPGPVNQPILLNVALVPSALNVRLILNGNHRYAPSGRLARALTTTDTTLQLRGIAASASPSWLRIDDEWLSAVPQPDGSYTVVRGMQLSAPQSHSAGTPILTGQTYTIVRPLD